MKEEEFVTPKDIMKVLGASRNEVYRLIQEGKFGPVLRIGAGEAKNRKIRLQPKYVQEFLNSGESPI